MPERLGFALLHFVWQGLLVAAAVATVARCLPRGRRRYAAYLWGMAVLVACLPATFVWHGLVPAEHTSFRVAESPNVAAEAPAEPVALARPSSSHNATRPSAPAREWLVAAVWVWLVGASLLSVRLPLAWLAVRRLRADAHPVGSALNGRVSALSRTLGLRRTVSVAASMRVVQPVVVGWLRPVILLPVSMSSGAPLATLDAIVAHELAHVVRRDLWVIYVQRLAETFLFYHPAVWWLSSRLNEEREICCDDLAVAATGRRVEYATALADAARSALFPAPRAALAFAPRRHATLDRVRHVLGIAPAQPAWGWASGSAAIAVVALLFALGCGLARPRATPGTRPPTVPAATAAGKPRVLLVTDGDFFLQNVVRAHDAYAVDVVAPDRYDANAAEAYQVVIFNGRLPSGRLPGVNTIFWGVAPPELSAGGVTAVTEPIRPDSTGHLLLRGVDLSKVRVTEARRLQLPAGWTPVASAGGEPLIVHYSTGPRPQNMVVVAFDNAHTDWPLRTSFPVFVHNALELLTTPKPTVTHQTARAATRPATQPATAKSVRRIFRPTTRDGTASWSSPIPDRAGGPGRAFVIVTSERGGRWPVRTRVDGEPLFHGKLIDGGERQLELEIDDGKAPPRRVTLKLAEPQTVDVAGRPFLLSYGSTTVAGEETQYSDKANIFIHFTAGETEGKERRD